MPISRKAKNAIYFGALIEDLQRDSRSGHNPIQRSRITQQKGSLAKVGVHIPDVSSVITGSNRRTRFVRSFSGVGWYFEESELFQRFFLTFSLLDVPYIYEGSSRRISLWIPQIPAVPIAIEISDMRNGTGGLVKKATGQ